MNGVSSKRGFIIILVGVKGTASVKYSSEIKHWRTRTTRTYNVDDIASESDLIHKQKQPFIPIYFILHWTTLL